MFPQTPQFYSTPSRNQLSNRQDNFNSSGVSFNSSGVDSWNEQHCDLSLHQKIDYLIDTNLHQNQDMTRLKSANEELQRELQSMKENIASLQSHVASQSVVSSNAAKVSHARVPPDVSVSSAYWLCHPLRPFLLPFTLFIYR